jgi:hypothetical protein
MAPATTIRRRPPNRSPCSAEPADAAQALGLAVNAGHDLTVDNLPALAKRIPFLSEVSIGHGLTADALIHGMEGAVKRFLKALRKLTSEVFAGLERSDAHAGGDQIGGRPADQQEAVDAFQRRQQAPLLACDDDRRSRRWRMSLVEK